MVKVFGKSIPRNVFSNFEDHTYKASEALNSKTGNVFSLEDEWHEELVGNRLNWPCGAVMRELSSVVVLV